MLGRLMDGTLATGTAPALLQGYQLYACKGMRLRAASYPCWVSVSLIFSPLLTDHWYSTSRGVSLPFVMHGGTFTCFANVLHTEPCVGALVEAMASHSATGSVLCADVVDPANIAHAQARKAAAEEGGKGAVEAFKAMTDNHFVWGCDDPAAFFCAHGWNSTR